MLMILDVIKMLIELAADLARPERGLVTSIFITTFSANLRNSFNFPLWVLDWLQISN